MGEVTLKGGNELPTKKTKKKHYWWRYLLTFFGGFLFCVGCIAGGAAIAATQIKTKDVVGWLGLNPDEYLSLQYQNDNLMDFISKMSNKKFETLGDLNDVSPAIKKMIDDLNTDIFEPELHYSLDWEELKNKPFELNPSSPRPEAEYDHTYSLGDYIPKALKEGITLVSFMDVEDPSDLDKILKLFMFGSHIDPETGDYVFDYNDPVTLADIMDDSDFFDSKINGLRIKDVADLGNSPFAAQIGDWTLTEFSENADEKIKTLKIGPLFSDEEAQDNPLISTLKGTFIDAETGEEKEWTIKDLTNFENIENLRINQILDVSGSSGLLASIGNNKLKDLNDPNFIDRLKLADVFTQPEGILKVLAEKDAYESTYNLYYYLDGYISTGAAAEFMGEGAPHDPSDSQYWIDNYSLVPQIKNVHTGYPGDIYFDTLDENLDNQDRMPMYILEKFGWRRIESYTVGDLSDEDKILDLYVSDIFADLDENDFIYNFKDYTLKSLSTIDIATIKLTELYSLEEIQADVLLNALYEEDHEVTLGDLSDFDTIKNLDLSILLPAGENQLLQALYNLTDEYDQPVKITIGNINEHINDLTLKDVIDVGDSNSMMYKIAHSAALENCKLSDLKDNFSNLLISDIFTVGPTSPQILQTLAGYELDELEDALDSLKAKDVMDIKPGDIYRNTVTDELFIRYSDSWEKVKDEEYAQEYSDYFTAETGYLALQTAVLYEGSVDANDSAYASIGTPRDILYTVRNESINDSQTIINGLKGNLKLCDVIEITNEDPYVLQNLRNYKISELSNILQNYTLGDIIHIDSNSPQILKSLAGVVVFSDGTDPNNPNLEQALVGLKFNDYFTAEDCQSGILKALWNVDNLDGDFLISDISTYINKIKIIDFLGNDIYYNPADPSSDQRTIGGVTYNKCNCIWWFLLTEGTESFTEQERFYVIRNGLDYTMSDLGKLVSNMEWHIKNEKIRVLVDAGLITLSPERVALIGEYTITQALSMSV